MKTYPVNVVVRLMVSASSDMELEDKLQEMSFTFEDPTNGSEMEAEVIDWNFANDEDEEEETVYPEELED